MVYEIRVRKYMGVGSTPLGKYYKNKKNAEEFAEQLNKLLPNMYFVQKLKLEDSDE